MSENGLNTIKYTNIIQTIPYKNQTFQGLGFRDKNPVWNIQL